MKSFELDNDNNNLNGSNGFKSFYSHISEKPMLDTSTVNSFSTRNQQNFSEIIDQPSAVYNTSTMNRSMIENVDQGSLNRGYISPNISITNSNYVTYDIGNPSLQRISYSSTNATSDSPKNIMNYSYSEVNEIRKSRGQNSLEHKQSKISSIHTTNGRVATPSVLSSIASSSVITSTIPGNMVRNNMKNNSMITDNNFINLHENSFQSNRSHVNYSNSQKENGYLSSNLYQKSPMSKSFCIENIPNNHQLSLNQRNNSINISNQHNNENFNGLEDLDNFNVDDVDAIVNNAENMLDALSRHSLSSSNNQTASLLGINNNINSSQKNTMVSNSDNVSNVAIRAKSTLDCSDMSFTSQNSVDGNINNMVQHGRNSNSSQANSFQKINSLQVHPVMDTYLRQIPEGKIVENLKRNTNEQIANNELLTQNNVKTNRPINENSFYIDEEITSPKQLRYNSQNNLSKNYNIASINSSLSMNNNNIQNNTIANHNTINIDNQYDDTDGKNILHDSILKSPNNFLIKSPVSPINANGNENKFSIGRMGRTNSQGINYDESIINRGSLYDDHNNVGNSSIIGTIGRTNRSNRSTLDSSIVRNSNSNRLIRNQSYMSNSTINTTLNRNGNYQSINNKSHVSTLSNDTSIYIESPSIISIENINAPSVKHSHKSINNGKKVPKVHKVKVNYSIDEIPENVDINDEVEEDVFMRPSMVRYVEIEPCPVLEQEAETTRISYISAEDSSEQPDLKQNILDELISSSEEEDHSSEEEEEEEEEKEKKNEEKKEKDEKGKPADIKRLESPMTFVSMASPTSSTNQEIIIKSSDDYLKEKKNRGSTSSCIELLKNNNANTEDDYSSPTLHESSITNDYNLENNQFETKSKIEA
jgi:hypothetical protein